VKNSPLQCARRFAVGAPSPNRVRLCLALLHWLFRPRFSHSVDTFFFFVCKHTPPSCAGTGLLPSRLMKFTVPPPFIILLLILFDTNTVSDCRFPSRPPQLWSFVLFCSSPPSFCPPRTLVCELPPVEEIPDFNFSPAGEFFNLISCFPLLVDGPSVDRARAVLP